MTAVTLSTAKKNLEQIILNVTDGCVPVTIVSDDGKNVVVVSEEDWNSMQETLYLYSIPGMVESIIEARKEPLSECKEYDPNEEW